MISPVGLERSLEGGELAAGAGILLVLLALLSAGVGLGGTGWLAGIGYASAGWALLAVGLHRSGSPSLGLADLVTLARAVLVGGVVALVADHFPRGAPAMPLVALASVALLLDAVDGHLARRTGTVSRLGARFDMEVDAVLILVLSVQVAATFGGWVIAVGAMRYVFAAAGLVAPWLRAELPVSLARKAVAALQGIVLLVACSGVLARPVAVVLLAVALALLGWSFGRDVGWLWRHRPVTPGPPVAARAPDAARWSRTRWSGRG
ncbi:MAG: CDP-alcohol phosphatidyltransferase family protein [Pseudonocardia sp.]|nr:CDP-alcohol phosphatidyltransferase family protein [Pseudonocardia sp.]